MAEEEVFTYDLINLAKFITSEDNDDEKNIAEDLGSIKNTCI